MCYTVAKNELLEKKIRCKIKLFLPDMILKRNDNFNIKKNPHILRAYVENIIKVTSFDGSIRDFDNEIMRYKVIRTEGGYLLMNL